MQFQNTIAYGTFVNDGGIQIIPAGVWTDFDYTPSPKVNKNIVVPNGVEGFKVQVKNTGMYYVEFSFISDGGDSKNYDIRPYKNNVAYNTDGLGQIIRAYQQPVEQKYEVSTHGLFILSYNDTLAWKIKRSSVPTVDYYARNIRMNLINLQQLGLH